MTTDPAIRIDVAPEARESAGARVPHVVRVPATERGTALSRALGTAFAWFLRLRHGTWRKDTGELAKIDALLASGERVMAVFWHGNYVPLFSLLSGRRACVFASDSFRGRVIAEICRRFGYETVLLPDRGGRRARDLMRAGLAPYQAGAVAVDGPQGPFHAVKAGAIEFASSLGFVLVPVSVSADRTHVNADRWDLMETPKLFSRVYLAVGEPIRFPPDLDEEGLAAGRAEVGAALEAVTLRAQAAARAFASQA